MTTPALELPAEALCSHCVESQGLCRKHSRGILPELKKPSWVKLIRTRLELANAKPPKESREARLVRRRKERKAAKRTKRITRLVLGQFAPARPSAN